MPVHVEDPRSFEVEKFLLAYSAAKKLGLSLIDPSTGLEIYHRLANIPIVGLTFQPTPDHKAPFGFPGVPAEKAHPEDCEKEDDESRPTFNPEALLVLDVDPRDLPKKMKLPVWVIQVEDFKDEPAFIEIAEILSAQFDDINIVVTSAHKQNTDPEMMDGIPADPRFPNSAPYCPIVIRRVKPTKPTPQPS
jgi:hypothetical protein